MISPEHFKEVLGVVAMTSKMNQREIAEYLEVHPMTLRRWQRKGVKPKYALSVMDKFRKLIRGN